MLEDLSGVISLILISLNYVFRKATGRRNAASLPTNSQINTSNQEETTNPHHVNTPSALHPPPVPSLPSSPAPQETSSQIIPAVPPKQATPSPISQFPPTPPQHRESVPVISARRIEYSTSLRSPSEGTPNTQRPERPRLARSTSTKEVIKNYIKKETATFFGVAEDSEEQQKQIWLDRRKRLASRAYGELKEQYSVPYGRTLRPRTYGGGKLLIAS